MVLLSENNVAPKFRIWFDSKIKPTTIKSEVASWYPSDRKSLSTCFICHMTLSAMRSIKQKLLRRIYYTKICQLFYFSSSGSKLRFLPFWICSLSFVILTFLLLAPSSTLRSYNKLVIFNSWLFKICSSFDHLHK